MKYVSLAVQALSACDRLEQGVRDGDKESIEAVKAMIQRWANQDFQEVQGVLAIAFKAIMIKCLEGGPTELALAMLALRCLTEHQVAVAFGNEDTEIEEE